MSAFTFRQEALFTFAGCPTQFFELALPHYLVWWVPLPKGVVVVENLIALYSFKWGFLWADLPFLLGGLLESLKLAAIGAALAYPFALIIAGWRMCRIRPVQWVAQFYIDFFRATPFLTQLLWMYFALPILLGIDLSPVVAGALALMLNYAAYQGEVFRAGLESIERGQREAARALGMSGAQALRRVLVPQAIVRVLPASLSQLTSLIKDTSLLSVITIAELTYRAQAIAGVTLRSVEPLTAAAVLYVIVIWPLAAVANYLHRRLLAT